jgi:YVTN family beta-propeller protein
MSQAQLRSRVFLFVFLLSFVFSLSVVSGAQSVITSVPTGNKPGAIAVNETTNKIYVINTYDDIVSVIDGLTNNATIAASALQNPVVIAVNPATNKIYVGNNNGSSVASVVTLIYGSNLATTNITVGKGVGALAVNSTTNRIYAINGLDNTVSVINGDTNGTSTVATGAGPIAMAVNPKTNKVYVVNYYDGNVTVIDGASNATSTVKVGTYPFRVAVNPTTNKIYVLNSVTNLQMTVTVIDGATNSTSTIVLGTTSDNTPGSQDIAVDTVANRVYVTAGTDLSNLGRLNIIDAATKTVTSKLTVGYKPVVVLANSKSNKIYVANSGSNTVSVIDGATNKITTLNVGTDPAHMAINATTDRAYVANQGSGTVSVIGVAAIATTTSITADVNPADLGSKVTFTGYVAPQSGTAAPGGNLTFNVDGTDVSTVALDGTGHASYVTGALGIGTHTVKASYAANSMFAASSGSMTETIQAAAAATPIFSPVAGTYYSAQSVTISDATPGAVVYYTTDGSIPTTASTQYTSAIAITKTTTLKAIATASGCATSAIASALYNILPPLAATPTFNVKPAMYTSTRWVSLADATNGAAIYYTTDGTAPTASSNLFSGPVTISSTTTLKAIAVASGYSNSTVATGTYTIRPPAWIPTFSQATGGYSGAQTIRIGDITPGAIIYYTTDGSVPTTASTKYVTPLTIGMTTTVKALATATGYANSPVASATYTIK